MLSFSEHQEGYDHVNMFYNGKWIGYKGLDGTLGLHRCPDCRAENYALAVSNGVCVWCGWDAKKYASLCHDCKKANVSCPVYPIITQTCVEYVKVQPKMMLDYLPVFELRV